MTKMVWSSTFLTQEELSAKFTRVMCNTIKRLSKLHDAEPDDLEKIVFEWNNYEDLFGNITKEDLLLEDLHLLEPDLRSCISGWSNTHSVFDEFHDPKSVVDITHQLTERVQSLHKKDVHSCSIYDCSEHPSRFRYDEIVDDVE
jgi:hypothetical protein